MADNLEGKPIMTTRSVIKGSKNSHFIHLPKAWLERHGIKKGDRLMVTGLYRLVLHPPERAND